MECATPAEAKAILTANPKITQLPAETYEPDETGVKILVRLARGSDGVTKEQLVGFLNLHPERVRLQLSELQEHGYIYSVWAGIAGAPTTYHLYEKASRLLVKKEII